MWAGAPVRRWLRGPVASVAGGDVVLWPAALAAVLVAIASYLVGPDRGDVRVDVAMASMAAFLFGVLLAFTIVRTRERLALVQNLVAKGNSSLFSIHQMMAVFPEAERNRIRDLVDGHLTDQIDYRLVDYHLATPSHLALTDAVYALHPDGPQEEAVYKELVALCIEMSADRSLIEAATGQALSAIEWSGLLLLLLLLIGLIAVLPGGTVLGALVVGVLAGTLVTFMILLRKLDRLRWHERVTIWEPTARLFRNMGREPYVPREVIEGGRFVPTGLVRMVEYPDPYPTRSTKIVRVVDVHGSGPGAPPRRDASVGEVA
ncbi:MAG: hypothetical protein ABSB68_10640 [Acidimicrobiales bacterium]